MNHTLDPFNFEQFRPYVVVDVEATGPVLGLYSMFSFAAVVVEPNLSRTFKAYVRCLPDTDYVQEALDVSGLTTDDLMSDKKYRDPSLVMMDFKRWLSKLNNPRFMSDNPCFDWMFIEYYFTLFVGLYSNPFGYSGGDLGEVFGGMHSDMNLKPSHFSRIKHTHDPLDDAMGNAQKLLAMIQNGGLIPKVQKS
jgi:hypothetical protein